MIWSPYLRDLPDWRTRAVFERNAQVYLRNWRTAFLPPALEPIVSLLAFGIGLGAYVGAMKWHGQTVDYISYMAPGLVAQTVFATPFFEALYSSYVRMFYQKTWDGILATQVELRHIVWGEITWASARGVMNASVVAGVLAIANALGALHIHAVWLPVLPVIGFLVGWSFAAFGLCFTAIVPSIDHMNFPVFLVGIPLGLISNTYFPIDTHSPIVSALMHANPIYHLAELYRSLLLGDGPDVHLLWLAGTAAAWLLVLGTAAQTLVHRRVLQEP
jgi:lipooligosaccharide transport system permease protein